jgi:hypothetical protein
MDRLFHREAGEPQPLAGRAVCCVRGATAVTSVAVLVAAWRTLALAMLGAAIAAAAPATGTSVT